MSTDSEKIKKIALSYGAGVPFMRDKYFDDKSPSSLATFQTVRNKQELGLEFSYISASSSCPFRDEKVIRKSLISFRKKKFIL